LAGRERRGPRRQIAGVAAIDAALSGGEPVRVVLVLEGLAEPGVAEVLERARAAGAVVREVSEKVVHRLSHDRPAADLIAQVGSGGGGSLDDAFAGRGAVWLLAGVTYPGNAGFAIRTAEVSGADGIVIDAAFDRTSRRDALRLSMRADWFMPVCWEPADVAIQQARATGHRVVAIEDVGDRAPWEVDLTGPVLFAIGGEEPGIPPHILEGCDAIVRVPMGGFIRSYNLQAALSSVAVERLRQLEGQTGSGGGGR
jgi:tRNA G18 (ribose-2'-O)-methylase SpoU